MDFERVVQVAKNREYVSKHQYYRDILKSSPQDAVLAMESAADYHNLSSRRFTMDVHVYAMCSLPEPFIVHPVTNFEDIEFVEMDGIKVTSVNQTATDLLASEDVDLQILLEFLGMYYYKNQESFSGLCIDVVNLHRFDEIKQWAIDYWND